VWRSQLELTVVEQIGRYNGARLHESVGHIAPIEYEQKHPLEDRLRSQERS
jgi:hypothetical protein